MSKERHVSDLTVHLGYWLRFVSNHVSQAFARKVEARGVTVAEWVLLRQLLDEEALAPSRLSERMGMTRGTVSKLAERLIAKGLIVRTANPEDARAQTLSLTEKGRRLVPELAALADTNDSEFFDHLAPKDRAALFRILRGIVKKRGLQSAPVD
jgi:DNA-binding MarR family transcriptional regulator